MSKCFPSVAALLVLTILAGCGEIRGPRGLRTSEWVLYCSENPANSLCLGLDEELPQDSVFVSGLIFRKNAVSEYQVDSSSGATLFRWVDLIDPEWELVINRDTVFTRNGLNSIGLYGYRLFEGFLTITSANPDFSQIPAGSVFSNVDGVPENHPEIPEL